jgi:hypothetical protein
MLIYSKEIGYCVAVRECTLSVREIIITSNFFLINIRTVDIVWLKEMYGKCVRNKYYYWILG